MMMMIMMMMMRLTLALTGVSELLPVAAILLDAPVAELFGIFATISGLFNIALGILSVILSCLAGSLALVVVVEVIGGAVVLGEETGDAAVEVSNFRIFGLGS